MRKSLWLGTLCLSLLLPVVGRAQLDAFGGSFGDVPVEINAKETRFENGVAIAEEDVQINYNDVSLYADHAEYNPDTRDVLLIGNIRIYTKDNVFTGQRALYNLESKQIRALEFQGQYTPLKFHAMSVEAPSLHQFNIRNADLTVDDSSQPGFHVHAHTVRIYPDNRVVFQNSTMYIGQLPVFWLPYAFAYTNNTGFTVQPGYYTSWGYYMLTGYNFPIGKGDSVMATANLDYRQKHGFGLGLDARSTFGKDDRSYGTFKSYYAYDSNPNYNLAPGQPAGPDDHNRYRISFQNRTFLTDDIYATFDINKLSDVNFLEDYFPNEFRVDPQPDNYISLTKWSEFYTLTLLTRWQMNTFYETTERLPELTLSFKQHRLFDTPIFYDGTDSVGYLRRMFPSTSVLPDYDATRFDTFHQFSYPNTYFGWLSIIPKIGIRGTYYSKTGHTIAALSDQQLTQISNHRQQAQNLYLAAQQAGVQATTLQSTLNQTTDPAQRAALQEQISTLQNGQQADLAQAQSLENLATSIEDGTALNGATLESGGSTFRPVVNFGIEGSFKLSQKFEWIQLHALGLDGVLHTIQPYANYSYVYNAGQSRQNILQFDRVVPATEPLPIDFPEFVAIDSIDSWNILRLGVRNRLTTRRGDDNYEWFMADSFFDLDFNNPYIVNGSTNNTVSNLVNRLVFRPVDWASLNMDYQLPLTSNGFTNVNAYVLFMPWRDLLLQIGDQYIKNNPFFSNSNQINGYVYYQLNPNWGVSAQGTYEAVQNVWLTQQYMIHRDLSSWIVSFGGQVLNNNGTRTKSSQTNYGVVISMALKDAPQITLPLAVDAGTTPLGGPAP